MPATPATPPPALRPYLTARHELLWDEADAFAAEHVAPRAVRMEAAPGRVERKVADLMAARAGSPSPSRPPSAVWAPAMWPERS